MTRLHSTKVREVPCRRCGSLNDHATHHRNRAISPEPGNINICAQCGEMSIYEEGLTLRPLTDDERADLPRRALEIVAAIQGRMTN